MRGIGRAVAAAALLTSAAGQAQGGLVSQDFCHGLERVIEAAQYEGGFDLLERARAAPPHLGFRGGCRATGDERREYWSCGQNLAPVEKRLAALAERVQACLPEAVRAPPGLARDAVFTVPHARIRISERGGPRAHVGRIVSFTVERTRP
jgi:hypothetical protein